jgi:hypothetical protein
MFNLTRTTQGIIFTLSSGITTLNITVSETQLQILADYIYKFLGRNK